MIKHVNPSREEWDKLIQRPVFEAQSLHETVSNILAEVKDGGDDTLLEYTRKFDSDQVDGLMVSEEEIEASYLAVPEELKEAIVLAKDNIGKFHESQRLTGEEVVTMDGVRCWRKEVAIEKVGLYIPGGTAPLFSTILMLAVPAAIAGCREMIMCTPPQKDGTVNPVILYTASLCGISTIIKAGGAQAIAAMAYGTESVTKVDKIFGPGNQYVTAAKQIVASQSTAIDLPAGPSEVLIIADKSADADFIAADLLSQAEHGIDSQVIFLTDDIELCDKVLLKTEMQMESLPRRDMAKEAIHNSKAIVLKDIEECIVFSNLYAPEHLIIATENSEILASKISNAGSVFLGPYTPESAGDYASGTNHTLPTNGFARSYSGVNLQSFTKVITFQSISKDGLRAIGPAIQRMAAAELLEAHKNAVTIRLKKINQ